jgi:hypothetical protein
MFDLIDSLPHELWIAWGCWLTLVAFFSSAFALASLSACRLKRDFGCFAVLFLVLSLLSVTAGTLTLLFW